MYKRTCALVALYLFVRLFAFGDLVNLSSRQILGTGDSDNVIYLEFEIAASTDVLLRHVGPALEGGIGGGLPDPDLELYDASELLIGSNDDWGGDADLLDAFSMIGSFPWDPSSSDSALLMTLDPGRYRMKAFSDSGTTGNCLVEVFAMDWNNVSFRSVSVEASGPIPTCMIRNTASDLMIRKLAVGVDGTLDPVIDVSYGSGNHVASNDNWEDGPDAALINPLSTAMGFSQKMNPGSKDSAVLLRGLDQNVYGVAGSSTGRVRVDIADVTGIQIDPLIGGVEVGDLSLWFRSDWFGLYNTDLAPWLFHAQHGFLYRYPESTNASMFVYDDVMGAWWWTNEDTYPFIFVYNPPADNAGADIGAEWLFYFEASRSPRSFGVVTGASAGSILFFGP